jgi:hypothetical protein
MIDVRVRLLNEVKKNVYVGGGRGEENMSRKIYINQSLVYAYIDKTREDIYLSILDEHSRETNDFRISLSVNVLFDW